MKELDSALMSLATVLRSNKELLDQPIVLTFPWGDQEELAVRELAYLRYVFSLSQPQRGTLILRLLGLQRKFTLRQRMSLIPNFVRLKRFSRMHLVESTRRIALRPTGEQSTTPT